MPRAPRKPKPGPGPGPGPGPDALELMSTSTTTVAETSHVAPSQSISQEHESIRVLYATQQEKEKYLDELKTTIEALDVSHHVEILQKLQDFPGGVKINENRNGVYINLSYLPDPLIRELSETVQYIKNQESILNIDEMSKDQFKRAYFAVQTT